MSEDFSAKIDEILNDSTKSDIDNIKNAIREIAEDYHVFKSRTLDDMLFKIKQLEKK